MAGRKYSEEQKQRFFDLVDRGGTVRAAAVAVGVHPDAAYTWLRQAGLTTRRETPRVYSEAEKARFFRLLAERGNVSAVARELGFTRVTCYKWAHQAGVFTSEARRVNPRREDSAVACRGTDTWSGGRAGTCRQALRGGLGQGHHDRPSRTRLSRR
ncbi:helix-turn-helix domain-containing protein [Longispora sp. NPDC051575]|uniref:helix-turn-helix domain-containing protein n=1 Tax=Longispora sp. NPDC051575 TaxID=3154943 RepID=UPI00341EF3D3